MRLFTNASFLCQVCRGTRSPTHLSTNSLPNDFNVAKMSQGHSAGSPQRQLRAICLAFSTADGATLFGTKYKDERNQKINLRVRVFHSGPLENPKVKIIPDPIHWYLFKFNNKKVEIRTAPFGFSWLSSTLILFSTSFSLSPFLVLRLDNWECALCAAAAELKLLSIYIM